MINLKLLYRLVRIVWKDLLRYSGVKNELKLLLRIMLIKKSPPVIFTMFFGLVS